ncbi:MAG: WhiB family transcriptional regulator [Micrococcales bacterium]|nr:WhiB family transcriptional regulator [Micrococcales bacterium]
MSDDISYLYEQVAEIFQTSWRHAAACVDSDEEIFFDPSRKDEAESICKGCPVKFKCLDHALTDNETEFHYYLSESDRYSLMLHRRRHLAAFRYDIGLL